MGQGHVKRMRLANVAQCSACSGTSECSACGEERTSRKVAHPESIMHESYMHDTVTAYRDRWRRERHLDGEMRIMEGMYLTLSLPHPSRPPIHI
jgi:hypothetical protein